MKKFFSLIALVGVFAACQPDDLKTVFQSFPAQLTINVSKVTNSINGADVTGAASTTSFSTTGTPAIAAGTATVSATYNGATGSTSVDYPGILADTAPVVMSAPVFIPGNLGDYTITVEQETDWDNAEFVKEYILAEAKSHGYDHAGSLWVENASDYILSDSFSYENASGTDNVSDPTIIEAAFKEVVEANWRAVKESAEGLKMTPADAPQEFTVPAWSLYKAVNTVCKAVTTYKVIATPNGNAPTVGDNGVVGTFTAETFQSAAKVDFMDHPSHAGHGGHGGHGSGSNAGGGLVPAE